MTSSWSQRGLLAAAVQLGGADVPGLSRTEKTLLLQAGTPCYSIVQLREQIRAGEDPLGLAFADLRAAVVRRTLGATYTPHAIVRSMLLWAREQGVPDRIVDPGAGSGRFLLQAARVFPQARLVGVEIDPLAALIARANLAAAGLTDRSRVELGDYRRICLRSPERTLYIGNPPYVRHHLINTRWKEWLTKQWRQFGIESSRLAGLHIHFFLATLLNANRDDHGAFITAAEWLDVNYGGALRTGFLQDLGGQGIVLLEPTAAPFPDAATTAAITLFRVGSRAPSIRVKRVSDLKELDSLAGGRLVSRKRLESETRWSRLTRVRRQRPSGYVELGELCRVHRGQATGANEIWIAGEDAQKLPRAVLFPTVTRARELITAGKVLGDLSRLRCVVDLPEDLDELDRAARTAVDQFLRHAKRCGAHASYLARHRRAWWAVGLRPPAPILATYMARRAPVFTRNPAKARHLNIAHGLYPREDFTEYQLCALIDHLSSGVSVADGRTYAGGLTKFEPREMERLLVPPPPAAPC